MDTSSRADRPPVRMLLLESGRGSGGSVTYIGDFVPRLDRRRIETFVGLYFPNPSPTFNELRLRGFSVTVFGNSQPMVERRSGSLEKRVKLIQDIRTAARFAAKALVTHLPQVWKLTHFIKRNGIELVLLNQDVHYHLSGVVAAKLAGVPCVCRKAGGIGEARRMKRVITPWVDLFISISKATHDDQRSTPGTKRVLTIYEGVDLERRDFLPSKQAMRRELRLPEGKKVVASIARIAEGKGQIEFVRMAAEVLRRDPNVIFVIVGDQEADGGGLLNEIKALVRELHLDSAVIFTGWRDDVPAVLSAVDIFVHCPTTWIEGLSIANLEAMAMAKPTVVSDNGGLPDAVLDGITGFIVPPGDINAMASAVLRLLADEELCVEQGANGRVRAEQMFDINRNTRLTEEAVLECVGAATQRRGAAAGAA